MGYSPWGCKELDMTWQLSISTHSIIYSFSFSFPCIQSFVWIYVYIHICMDIYIHVYILFHYGLLQNIEYNFLCYTLGPCYLSILPILVYINSVTQSCLTVCNPMDCSPPGFPVHHQLPELTQTHVHRVSDDIQPSHPLSSRSPPAFSLSQHQALLDSA